MNGEYIIDSYLDWYFKDEYEEREEEDELIQEDSINSEKQTA